MKIIPALFLSQGKAVSRYKGDVEHRTILSHSPVAVARQFLQQGADTIHLVNLDDDDGAQNTALAYEIAALSGQSCAVQYASRFENLEEIQACLDAGIARISLTQYTESLLAPALAEFGPDKIWFTIISRRESVDGFKDLDVFDYGQKIGRSGVQHIIANDKQAEGTDHPNYDVVERLLIVTQAHIYAFGGVTKHEHLALLQKTGAAGVLISPALLDGTLNLKECMARFTT
ncbi:hypothetical protein COV82_03445 [Candidatus Peregrinibacteria bacterium CG11_big_fil_rev_8_21_14_0_20_46_8]|nr:MAG: hypothetical protein COV82_03445 [Candidatus Peregrinibacteria bacterium CG11_big_fil_rev_8_21_14_0_20_46_8]